MAILLLRMIDLRLPRPHQRATRKLGRREGDIVRGDRLFEMLAVCIRRGYILLERYPSRIDACPSRCLYAGVLHAATDSSHQRYMKFAVSWRALEVSLLSSPPRSSAHLSTFALSRILLTHGLILASGTLHSICLIALLPWSERTFSPV